MDAAGRSCAKLPDIGNLTLNHFSEVSRVVVRTPAKLNLFLELMARRSDGYHDIDTVMVPINCYDTLDFRRAEHGTIRIATNWWPSHQHWVQELGPAQADLLLYIPDDERNLIHRAILATSELGRLSGGFNVEVRKRIPAGAGMGGASSDAAAAIRAVAKFGGISSTDTRLWTIAAQIGSDVPFFLGAEPGNRGGEERQRITVSRVTAMRATGRGEILSPVSLRKPLNLIVAFPAESLSTAKVYSHCVVPSQSTNVATMIEALESGEPARIGEAMMNRLTESALKLSATVKDLLEQMWRCGLPRCQLTGSGSACFSLIDDSCDAESLMKVLRHSLRANSMNAHIIRVETVAIPQRIFVSRKLAHLKTDI